MSDCLLISAMKVSEIRAAARIIRESVGIEAGDPVVAVASLRLIVRPEVMEIMGAASTEAFESMLQTIGEIRVTELPDHRVAELLGSRHGPELPVPKIDPGTPEVGDKFDWHLRTCHFPEAWAQLHATDFGQIDWGSVLVGQIDTGFCEHPALGFQGGVSTTVNTALDKNYFQGDFSRPGYSVDDAHDPLAGAAYDGHGTRTGAVLAGYFVRQSLAGALNGYFGAAPQVPYVPARISNSVIVSDAQPALAEAITYLVSINCKVITLSMGFPLIPIFGGGVIPEVKRAINLAYDSGVILICAAGNVVSKVVAPAALNRTIAVGGSAQSDVPWIGSSCGPEVDLSAPAWPIYRATMDRSGKPTYGFGDGTSFATALTAGAAALWLARHGNALQAAYPQPWQRVAAFKKLVTANARVPAGGWDTTHFGNGILNADALLLASLPAATSLRLEPPA